MFANRGMHKHPPSTRPSHKVHCSGVRVFSKGHLDLYHSTPFQHVFLLVKPKSRQRDQRTVWADRKLYLGIHLVAWLAGTDWQESGGANMIAFPVWPTTINQTIHRCDDNHSANSSPPNNECITALLSLARLTWAVTSCWQLTLYGSEFPEFSREDKLLKE